MIAREIHNNKGTTVITGFLKILIFVIILGVIMFLLYKFVFMDKILTHVAEEDKVTYEVEYIQFSFDDYLTNITEYDGQQVTLSGFIYKTMEKRGSDNYYVEKLVDDFDNEIRLLNTESAIGKENVIENTFVNVTGILKKRPSKVDLDVTKIVIASRPSKLIEKKVVTPKIEPVKKESRLKDNLSVGLTKILNNLKEKALYLGEETKTFASDTAEGISQSIQEYEVEAQRSEEERYKVMCMEAFDYVNELRIENGRSKLIWDERAYQLAVWRSKDMFDRGYFDHVTPEGECAKDFKSRFGFEDYENLAENLGGMTHYSDGTPIESTDATEAINGWMNSRGHRYNLLYESHINGAIGCYKSICAFYGINTDDYGLGVGPCTTGEQGLNFWRNAPTEHGEI